MGWKGTADTSRLREIEQVAHIPPAEIQSLTTNRVAAMPRFTHQQQVGAVELWGETEFQREGPWVIQKSSGTNSLRKNGR